MAIKPRYAIVIVGGGAAGFFAAIRAAEALQKKGEVLLLERGPQFLSKVRISGGGRCNVTHACFEPRRLAAHYPRGERALIGPFSRFQPRDTVAWFNERGVALKTEEDGRMFPTTDSSSTIIDALTRAADEAGVQRELRCGVTNIEPLDATGGGGFRLSLTGGESLVCERLLMATGGSRAGDSLISKHTGHTIEPPVPSLFTFHIETPWLQELAGVSVERVEARVPGTRLREQGPFLATHWGASGPVVLRLSAWGARVLHERDYRFPLVINWLPEMNHDEVAAELRSRRQAALVVKVPMRPLPQRLWEKLVAAAGIPPDQRWSTLSRPALLALARQLTATEFSVTGKSTHKAEFVTCGGVRLSEVDFRTMESRLVPGLHFAGEVLDIDGITGGFNFQAAWTTGWIAGGTMAAAVQAGSPPRVSID